MDGQVQQIPTPETKFVPLAHAQDHGANSSDKEYGEEFFAQVADAVTPLTYWYVVMPVGMIKKSAGGIMFTDQSVAMQKWTHGLGKVVCAGPGVYRGKLFAEQGIEPEDAPKVGDLVCYDPKTPKKFKFKGIDLVQVPDNALNAIVNPDHASDVTWDFGF